MKNIIARGTLWIMFSQIVFMFSNYLIHIFLGRTFGPELYGVFGIVLSLIVIVQIFLQKGLPQAVSKFIAEHKDKQKSIYKTSIRLQFYLAAFFTLIYFLGADMIATSFLKDPELTNYLRFSSILILPMAFFALYSSGFLNGARLFKQQSYTRVIHSLAKLFLVFLAVFVGFRIYGLVGAYIIATIIAFFAAKFFFKVKQTEVLFSKKKLIFFALPIIIFSAAYKLTRYLDLLFIKRILADDSLAGFYTSAMTLSEISLFLFAALPFTLLPSISKSTAEKDIKTTNSYINKSLRYALLLMIPLAFLISATSKNIISLLYSSKFIDAAPALSILVFGATFLSLFSINCSIITGSGKPKIAMLFGSILIPISISLNYLLIPVYGIKGAAISTTITTFLGMIMTSAYVYKKFKTLVSVKSVIKIILASFFIYYLALQHQFSGVELLFTYLILVGTYFLTLFVLKEIKQEDIVLIKKIIKK